LISVIIPAREEPYLDRTIASLYDNSAGEIEVIVVLEGERIEVDPRAQVIHHPNPLGRRVGMNEAAKIANGEYLFHIDAHCSMSEGWDEKLKEVCIDKTVVVSVVGAMDENTWEIKKNHYYTFVSIDRNMKEHWWGSYKPLRKCGKVEETMALTGCGWMIRKDFYLALGGCDESLGQLCHLGPEWALKVWCNDGRLLLRTDVFCGHVFGSPRIQSYSPQHIGDYDFARRMRNQYGDKIDKLREKFNPPGWEDDVVEKVKEEVKITRRTTINNMEAYRQENKDKPWVTCFMLYYGRYDVAQESVESFLAQTYPNKKLMIVNTHPDPVYFEEDFSSYEIEIHNLPNPQMNLHDKYTWALQHIDTQWCMAWDSDDIFLPWHIENLVANISKVPQNGRPKRIGELYRFASNHNAIRGFGGRLWQMYIFEPYELKDVEHPEVHFGTFAKPKWDEYLIDQTKYPLSFIYRWGMNIPHGSERATKEERDEHSRESREKYSAIPLKKPFRPHWKQNYLEDVRSFLASSSKTIPIATNEELLALVPEVT